MDAFGVTGILRAQKVFLHFPRRRVHPPLLATRSTQRFRQGALLRLLRPFHPPAPARLAPNAHTVVSREQPPWPRPARPETFSSQPPPGFFLPNLWSAHETLALHSAHRTLPTRIAACSFSPSPSLDAVHLRSIPGSVYPQENSPMKSSSTRPSKIDSSDLFSCIISYIRMDSRECLGLAVTHNPQQFLDLPKTAQFNSD